jgi:hypothetical protein
MKAMAGFDVLFVGLFCFKKDARQAVMPDGRTPDDPAIPPYIPFLVVDPKDIQSSSGWDGNDPARTAQGIYTFGKCTISITRIADVGPIDTSQHDKNVAKLAEIDTGFNFNSSGEIITTIPFQQGTLELLRRPDQDNANVTRLTVDYDGDIAVSIHVDGEPNARILNLKPRSAVAIANLPLPPVKALQNGNPAKLFGKIATSGTFNSPNPIHVPGMPAIGANYQVFKVGLDISASGPGGCCPPP